MTRAGLQASLTGLFCIVFAVVVDMVTEVLSLGALIAVSFASGFFGSLFGHFVLRGRATALPTGGRARREDPE